MQKEIYEYISQHIGEPIAEWRSCVYSGEPFAIFQGDMDFYVKVGPTLNGQKYVCLPPTLSPTERWRRKLSFRNNKKLYKSTCALTGKPIISMISPDKPYTVYHQDVRYSDAWDPLSYGQEIQSSKTVFEQYDELLHKVPKMALINVNTENSQYANYIADAKNCYMTSIAYHGNENLYYCFRMMMGCQECSDCYHSTKMKQSIGCSDCVSVQASYYLHECANVSFCYFSALLENCSHCLFCHNLINKQYCIHNKQVTKDEFTTYLAKLKASPDFFTHGYKKFQHLQQTLIVPNLRVVSSENCLGNNLYNCKDTVMSWNCEKMENCRYSRGEQATSVWDVSGGGIEMSLESINVGLENSSYFIGCSSILRCNYMYYCDNCYDNCSYCFGCVGLRNKQYCIFNKQYTKQEREIKTAKLIEQMIEERTWGHFPLPQLSTFGYNESWAHELYPLTKEAAIAKGFKRYEEKDTPPADQDGYMPLHISQYQSEVVGEELAQRHENDLLAQTIVCAVSGKPFKIMKLELDLYKKLGVPVPTLHPDERYKELYMRRAGETFYLRACDKTGEKILSVYPPDALCKVYSQKAYTQELYG